MTEAQPETETKEALYTLHVVTEFEVDSEIDGLKKIGGQSIGDKLFTSEWVITSNNLTQATAQFEKFEVVIKQFRVYKPEKDKFCVIDWKLLQEAINNEYTIQV
jgi:hypothetical protein